MADEKNGTEGGDHESYELRAEVSQALETLEEDEGPSDAIQHLLQTPQGKAAIQKILVTAIAVHEERHSGPLPPPRQLIEYDKAVPGGAERIFQMAEREQAHRHEIQRSEAQLRQATIQHIKSRETRGQHYGASLAFGVLALGAVMVFLGHVNIAAGLVGSTMVAIASVFVIRQRQKKTKPLPVNDDDSSEKE